MPGLWHHRAVSARTLFSALLAAVIGLGSIPAAEAQLFKPKKKSTVSAKKPVKKTVRRAKKPVRRKKPSSSSVVKFGPPKDRADEVDPDSLPPPEEDVDDNPRITVYDGDRDE